MPASNCLRYDTLRRRSVSAGVSLSYQETVVSVMRLSRGHRPGASFSREAFKTHINFYSNHMDSKRELARRTKIQAQRSGYLGWVCGVHVCFHNNTPVVILAREVRGTIGV